MIEPKSLMLVDGGPMISHEEMRRRQFAGTLYESFLEWKTERLKSCSHSMQDIEALFKGPNKALADEYLARTLAARRTIAALRVDPDNQEKHDAAVAALEAAASTVIA